MLETCQTVQFLTLEAYQSAQYLNYRRSPALPPRPFAGKACPVCSKLDLRSITSEEGNVSSLHYRIEPSEHDDDELCEWLEECSLCRLVYDLHQHWSTHGDDTQKLKYDGHLYRQACGRNGPDTDRLNLDILVDWGKSHFEFLND